MKKKGESSFFVNIFDRMPHAVNVETNFPIHLELLKATMIIACHVK